MGDIHLLSGFDLEEQIFGSRGFGSFAAQYVDDLLQAADVVLAFIDIALNDLQVSKNHRAIHSSTFFTARQAPL
jgi:hypothetical protein